MKKRLPIIIFVLFLNFATNGCAPVLIGGAAVAGAVAVSHDFATTSVDVSFQRAWKVANQQMKAVGQVDDSYRKVGEIKATVEGSKVIVKITRLTEKTVDIKVSARKNMLPNPDLAQAILASIIRKIK